MISRATIAVLACLALSGCYVKTYGVQSTGGAGSATVVSTQTVATAKFSAGQASFSSGQAVPAGAPGGQVSLGRGGAAVLAVGLVLVDALQYLGASFGAKPQPAVPLEAIGADCSCRRNPVTGNE